MSWPPMGSAGAGISSMPPETVGPLRRAERETSCAAVGVDDITCLEHRDGLVVTDLELRAELAGLIRRKMPEVVISINYRDSWGGSSWNHADHRAVGVALLDAVRDAANPWLFPELGESWGGVHMVASGGSPQATHGVDVTGSIESGVESRSCHRTYLENLDEPPDVAEFLRGSARGTGKRLGVELAAAFEVVTP